MSSKRTGQDAVMKMRDEFLKLVTAYNAVGMFENAAAAQKMAIALHEFESANIITNMAWPPRLVQQDGLKIIAPSDSEHSLLGLHRDYE